jgi:hypothetical protein
MLSHWQGGGCSQVLQGRKMIAEDKQQWCISKQERSGVLKNYKCSAEDHATRRLQLEVELQGNDGFWCRVVAGGQ